MTKRNHSKFFQVLVSKIGKDGEVDVVLSEPLSVLTETELLQPVCNSVALRVCS
jgi:hypothetical protein